MHTHISDAGTRRLTQDMIRGRKRAREAIENNAADLSACRYDVIKHVKMAREALGLRPIATQLLELMVSILRREDFNNGLLVVHPSNAFLVRETGYSIRSVQYALRSLIAAGLVTERRSANGKRFARLKHDRSKGVCFGFDLTPLYARECELREAAWNVEAAKAALREAREDVSRYRIAIEAELAALARADRTDEAQRLAGDLAAIIAALPDKPGIQDLETAAVGLERLLQIVQTVVESACEETNFAPNGRTDCTHKQTTNPDPFFSSDDRSCATAQQHHTQNAAARGERGSSKKPENFTVSQQDPQTPETRVDLGLMKQACPAVEEFAIDAYRSWDTFILAAEKVLCPTLGIGNHAWKKAAAVMGETMAAATVALVLEHASAERIETTAGAYFTALIERAQAGKLRLQVSLIKLARDRLNPDRG